jgi:formylglycine-generating enzyme required for sulfatase activity
MEMVYVEGGKWGNYTLKDYWIGKYEVTQGQWEALTGTSFADYCKKNGITTDISSVGHDYPMYWATGNEMYAFCDTLSARTGKTYRLTTEADWEYAARGGKFSKGYKYSGSNNVDDVAWYLDNSGGTHHIVGTKAGNELGIYDMSGNIAELCSSLLGGNPTVAGPSDNNHRRHRGASYSLPMSHAQITDYPFNKWKLWQRAPAVGFRVV